MADNSPHFWRYNSTSSRKSPPSRRSPTRFQQQQIEERRIRQRDILTILIECGGQSIQASRIAERIGHSQSATVNFMIRHDDGLWASGKNEAWWRTSLRAIPNRLNASQKPKAPSPMATPEPQASRDQ